MMCAQIKKGNLFLLDTLQDTFLQIIALPENKQLRPIKLTFYQLICTISDLIVEFIKNAPSDVNFNIFIIDYYISKYEKESEAYRNFIGLVHAWRKYLDVQEDARLYLSLLDDSRSNKNTIKEFVRIRKSILRNLSQKIQSEISITHSDMLTICHFLYVDGVRSRIIKKINQLFISLKRKLINSAKINGAVACEFFMNSFEGGDQDGAFQKQKKWKVNKENTNIKQVTNYNAHHNNVSFSQQYASYYKQNNQDDYSCDSINQLEEQWDEAKHFGLEEARLSLNKLFEKDKHMDEKLKNSGIMKSKEYPDGWEQFLKTNKLMKEKLLNNKPF